ncbi:MAG: formate/nitrite transporter family protein [Bacteroidaceae bacterium]|nr:formate/nitrite transporter family protein [Bacteroidaceae bacterium]
MKRLILDSIFAGLMIGFGCIVYIIVPDHTIGSFLFGFGLLTVVIQQKKLFTGMVGYANSWLQVRDLAVAIAGNLFAIGLLCWAFARFSGLALDTEALADAKFSEPWYAALLRAIGCGVMMFLAVDGWRKTSKAIAVLMPVMIFILCGFDHCIANYGYMAMAGRFFHPNLLIWIAGNAIGSQLMSRIGGHLSK